jgi:hypothetical protein
MKYLSPATIAVSAMGLALIWSLVSAPVNTDGGSEQHSAARTVQTTPAAYN